jgi:FixJ family two-component response regulator
MIDLRRECNLTKRLQFEKVERCPDEDLRLELEAMAQLSQKEKSVARAVLEGLILKHAARQWGNTSARTNPVPEGVK